MNNLETLLEKFDNYESRQTLALNILEAAKLKNCKSFQFGEDTLTIHVIDNHIFSISKAAFIKGYEMKQTIGITRYYPIHKFDDMMKELMNKENDFIKYWLD